MGEAKNREPEIKQAEALRMQQASQQRQELNTLAVLAKVPAIFATSVSLNITPDGSCFRITFGDQLHPALQPEPYTAVMMPIAAIEGMAKALNGMLEARMQMVKDRQFEQSQSDMNAESPGTSDGVAGAEASAVVTSALASEQNAKAIG